MKKSLVSFIAIGVLCSSAFADTIKPPLVEVASSQGLTPFSLLEDPASGHKYAPEHEPPSSATEPAIGLIVDTLYYHTNLSDHKLKTRSIAGYRTLLEESPTHAHSETERGLNLRSAELRLFSPVGPHLDLYITVLLSSAEPEVEEAYLVTTLLASGLWIKAGKLRSGFGRFNALHQHTRSFVDSPLPYRAFLGDEGLIERGIQLSHLARLPVRTLMGLEVLKAENETLFGKKDHPAYGGFVKASLELTEDSALFLGISMLHGDTKTSSIKPTSEFVGRSTIYGAELTYRWKPSEHRSLVFQGEYLLREQSGDYTEGGSAPTPLKRSQDGLYLQGLYQLGRWRVGARYDVLGILSDEFIQSGIELDFGSPPYRVTASVEFRPAESARIRLQYNHDRTSQDGKTHREFFLQFLLSIGSHGAHEGHNFQGGV